MPKIPDSHNNFIRRLPFLHCYFLRRSVASLRHSRSLGSFRLPAGYLRTPRCQEPDICEIDWFSKSCRKRDEVSRAQVAACKTRRLSRHSALHTISRLQRGGPWVWIILKPSAPPCARPEPRWLTAWRKVRMHSSCSTTKASWQRAKFHDTTGELCTQRFRAR